jgi:hypothetical protein
MTNEPLPAGRFRSILKRRSTFGSVSELSELSNVGALALRNSARRFINKNGR